MQQRRYHCLPLKRDPRPCCILVLAWDKLTTKPKNVRNHWVNFKIKDAYWPEPAWILMELHGDDLLQGKIVKASDSGFQKDAFAEVEVQGFAQHVVVPMNCITGVVCE